ncbi:AAA family ATPase [Streptomyces sioyaensis]|uniref:AAA family ATPase n=1 Tax=Streptomyces sioyaensis TaxID=67364 RepID=UPI0037B2BF90
MRNDGVFHNHAHPPRPARHLIARPRLTDRLQAALTARITALVAPAGYGKTSLIAQWLQTPGARERTVAVITLRERDDDMPRFARHLIETVKTFGAGAPHIEGLEAVLREEVRDPAQAAPEAFLRLLHDALDEVPRRGVLIVEDVHVLRRENVLGLLDFLADVLPPPVHLMFTSRTAVPLRRAHTLRVSGQLAELSTSELAFTQDEARAFLAETVGSLSARQAGLLAQRCEGWVAGLQLAGRALASHPDPHAFLREFTGHTRDVADFLLHEVLRHQPDGIKDFLLDAAVLDVLSADVCQAVTGRSDSGALLRTLEDEGGFLLGLDDGERYRFHTLYAEFLRGELARTNPDRAAACHLRAAGWFTHQGRLTEAFDHAIAARDFTLAGILLTRLVSSDAPHQLDPQLGALFSRLPRHIIERHPALSARMACLALWADQPADALRWCEHTAQLPDNADALAEASCMRVFAYWMLGDLPRTIAAGEQARALLDGRERDRRHHDTYPRLAMMEALAEAYECTGAYDAAMDVVRDGLERARAGVHPLVSVSFPGKMAALLSHLGRLDDVREYAELSLATAEQVGQSGQPPTIEARVALGELLWEQDDVSAAEEEFRSAASVCAVADRVWMRARSMIGLARCLSSQRRTGEAFSVLREAMGIDPRGSLPRFVRISIVEQQVRLRLANGDRAGARGWLAELQRLAADTEVFRGLQAWLDLDDGGDPRAVRDVACAMLQEDAGRPARATIRLHVLAARACRLSGESRQSDHHGAVALGLAAPQMMVRTLVEAAGPQDGAWLVARATGRGTRLPAPFAHALLNALDGEAGQASGRRSTRDAAPEALIEPLTGAELALIPLLATELTYAEIAASRFVSLNTVKSQMQAVYRKLGVTSRIAAIERSRALGLQAAPHIAQGPAPRRGPGPNHEMG